MPPYEHLSLVFCSWPVPVLLHPVGEHVKWSKQQVPWWHRIARLLIRLIPCGKEELSIPSAGLQPCNMQFHWSGWLMGKRHTYSEIYAVNISKLHIHVQTCQRTAASELLNSWHANTCCPCCSLPPLCRDVLHPIIISNQPWPTLEPYQSQESCCWRATHLSRRCPPWYEPHEELASNPDGIWWDVQPQSTLCRGVILRAHSAWHTASSHFPTIWWSQGLAPCWALEEDHPLPLHVRLLAI